MNYQSLKVIGLRYEHILQTQTIKLKLPLMNLTQHDAELQDCSS